MAREKRFEETFEEIYTGVPKPFKEEGLPEEQQYFAGRVEEWGLPDPDKLVEETAYKTGKGYGGRSEKALVSGFQSVKGKEEEGLQDEVTQLRIQMDALGLRNSPLHRMKEQSLLRKFNRTMAPLKQGLVEDVRSNVGRWWERTGEEFDPIYGGEGKYMESLDKTTNVAGWETGIKKGRQMDMDRWDRMKKGNLLQGIGHFFGGLVENVGWALGGWNAKTPWDRAGFGGAEEMVRQAKVAKSGDVEYFGQYEAAEPRVLGKSHGAITSDAWKEWSGDVLKEGGSLSVGDPNYIEGQAGIKGDWDEYYAEQGKQPSGIIKMPEEFAELELPDVLKQKKLESLQSGITYGGLMRDYRRGAV